MNETRRRLTFLYALTSVVLVAALATVTVMVERQQHEHARAVGEALYHEDLRIAMWRMETRVGSLLATTGNRALLDEPVLAGGYRNQWIDVRQNAVNPLAQPPVAFQQRAISAADEAFANANAAAATGVASAAERAGAGAPDRQQLLEGRGAERSEQEFLHRGWSNFNNQVQYANAGPLPGDSIVVGPLTPVWEQSDEGLQLYLARRIEAASGVTHEAYRIDWEPLRELLLDEVRDLFPAADLLPILAADARDDDAVRLAAIPARLELGGPPAAVDLPRGYLWTLGGAWLALALALAMGAFALRSSFAYGDKHRRFTHAVTHELRTPLTTFRMYSEMLSRGMVPESARAEYLSTLEAESQRLARLVENVLRYARLEEGRAGPERVVVGAAALLERCVPELARITAGAGATLTVEDLLVDGPPGAPLELRTDVEAVLQVLSNLVENACKYGCVRAADGEAAIVLRATSASQQVAFEVIDAGPGVPPALAQTIFEPFDRGGRDSSDAAPGVGLGLALSRELARELGGTLTLEPASRGATFRLTLPARSTPQARAR